MSDASFDVVGLGNAIVDVLAPASDAFVEQHGLAKGGMTLADAPASAALYDAMGPGTEMSGGSAANTMAGIASLGGRPAFFGRVSDDPLGAAVRPRYSRHRRELRDAADGRRRRHRPLPDSGDAGCRAHHADLPWDRRRSSGREDVDQATVRDAAIAYLEGYLFDPAPAKAAFRKAAQTAHAAGRKVALSLSDSFCVDRHRAAFRELVDGHIDILFANEDEIVSLYETADFAGALNAVRGKCEIAALTRSARGSVIVSAAGAVEVAAEPVEKVVDTTGAGDLYAAGFLHGLTHGRDLAGCARIGSICAAEVIGYFGARPAVPLKDLVAERMN